VKVGFIGYGAMGSIMVNAFLDHGALAPRDVIVSSRTASALAPLAARYPDVRMVDNRTAAEESDLLFLCVRSDQVRGVLEEIAPVLSGSCHLVLINGGVAMSAAPVRRVSKVIPTVTMRVGRGVALVSHQPEVEEERRARLERLFSSVGAVKVVREDELELTTALTSCGPALVATLVDELAAAAARRGLDREEAEAMVTETFLATALLMSDVAVPREVCESVATKGGITEKGLEVLRHRSPALFDDLLSAILSAHRGAEEDGDNGLSA